MHLTPLLKRIALAKLLGLLLGILGYFILSASSAHSDMLLLGLVGWFATLGALVGMIGFYQTIPVFNVPIPVWLRGGWCGAWLGLLLVLVAHGPLAQLTAGIAWLPDVFTSPWWLVVEMAFWGGVIDLGVTAAFGSVPWQASGVSLQAKV
jgi:hypothetical protein